MASSGGAGGRSPSPWLRPRAEVEVRSDEEGFRGVWYVALVHRIRRRRRVDVVYTSLLSDQDPTKLLRECVRVADVRPPPPPPPPGLRFALHELVEAFHNDGWWCGVVSAVVEDEGKYKVAFPTSREEILAEPAMIRPQLHWIGGQWQRPQEEQGVNCSVFTTAAEVEVCRESEHYGNSWFAAHIKKVINNTVFLVEYKNVKVNGDDELLTEIIDNHNIRPLQKVDSSVDFMVEDEVEVLIDGGWAPGVVLGILEGSNYRIKLDYDQEERVFNKSTVRRGWQWNGHEWVLINKEKNKTPGSRSKVAEKKQDSCADKCSSVPLSIAVSSDESGATCESNLSLSKRKKAEKPSPVDEIQTSNSKSFIGGGGSDELHKDHEIKSCQTSKRRRQMKLSENDKCPPDNFVSDGGSSELLNEHQIRNMNNVPVLPSQGEVLPVTDSESSVHLRDGAHTENLTVKLQEDSQTNGGHNPPVNCKMRTKQLAAKKSEAKALAEDEQDTTMIMNGSSEGHINEELKNSEESTNAVNECDDGRETVQLSKQEHNASENCHRNKESSHEGSKFIANAKGILSEKSSTVEAPTVLSNLSRTSVEENISDFQSDTRASCERQSVQPSLQKNGNLSTSEQPKENMVTDNRSSIDTSVTPSMSELPFVKSSALWDVIDSMEVFKNLPQKPHFQPLKQYATEFREGMAIGLMISFANLVSSVKKLQVDDAQTIIEGKFEALVPLRKNGFNVQYLQLRIQKLLEFQACQAEFESKRLSIIEKILTKNEDNAKLDTSITALDKSISEIQEKLKKIQEERDSLCLQRESNTSEICKMQDDLSKAEEAYNSTEKCLNASLNASW